MVGAPENLLRDRNPLCYFLMYGRWVGGQKKRSRSTWKTSGAVWGEKNKASCTDQLIMISGSEPSS